MVQVEAAEIRVLFPIGVGRACRELPPPSDGRESEQFPCFFGGPISGGSTLKQGRTPARTTPILTRDRVRGG